MSGKKKPVADKCEETAAKPVKLSDISDDAWKLARLCAVLWGQPLFEYAYSEDDPASRPSLSHRLFPLSESIPDEHPGRALIYDTLTLLFHCQSVLSNPDTLQFFQGQVERFDARRGTLDRDGNRIVPEVNDRLKYLEARDQMHQGLEKLHEEGLKLRNAGIVSHDRHGRFIDLERLWKSHSFRDPNLAMDEQMLHDFAKKNADFHLEEQRLYIQSWFEGQVVAELREFATNWHKERARRNRQDGASKARQKLRSKRTTANE